MTLLLGIVCGFICLLFSITKNLKIYFVPTALVFLSILTLLSRIAVQCGYQDYFFNSVRCKFLEDKLIKTINLVINFKEK